MSRSKAVRPSLPRSLVLSPHELAAIVYHVEGAYPEEACGLIVGAKPVRGRCVASRVVPSANVATGDARHRFEVDPALRLKLERELRESGGAVLGHYHSHPDHPAVPSAHDLDRAYEPELAWLIVSVEAGKARACAAFQIERDTKRARPIALEMAGDAKAVAKAKPPRSPRKPK